MNKGFLFATSSRKIKSHGVNSQITSLVWPCLSLTEKQHTVNHMIIFNDSVSKFYQCSVRNSLRHSANAEAISTFFSICLSKKKKKSAEETKFSGILKKYVTKNIFFKKKAMFFLNKKVFCLSHEFQTCFYNADHFLYYPQMSVFFFQTFLFGYISF